MKTPHDITEYIWNHKERSKLFPKWTHEQIAQRVLEASQRTGISWSVNLQGEVDGVVIVEPKANNELYVDVVLIDHHQALWGFLKKYYDYYPDWTIVARRKGEMVKYKNTRRFIKSLWKSTLRLRKK
jgi:hypothetical protein